MSAQPLSNPPRKSALTDSVPQTDRIPELTAEDRVSLRGVLLASALATPFWLALYLLLR